MKIGIIGAGFTGLAAAYFLQKKGHTVTIIEKDSKPGGLAIGYKEKEWKWSLEQHYHHWFTNDTSVLSLAKEINYEVIIKKPKSSFYIAGASYQFDSPLTLLTFNKLPLIDRVRMATVFAVLFRFNPFWKLLEGARLSDVVPRLIGEKAYTMLWEPQLINKMGSYKDQISLVWFWARIKKRTTSLAYPSGGFLQFATTLSERIKKNNGVIVYNTETINIKENKNKSIIVSTRSPDGTIGEHIFDKVIVTLPTHLFVTISPNLPQDYKNSLVKLEGLGATNLVIRLKKPFLKDNTYWLSICDTTSKIMVIVEHTNFMDKKNYNNEHIIYIGNYLKVTDDNFTKSKEELLDIYDPFLRKINPDYRNTIIGYELFKAPFAQPIIPLNYSRHIPSFKTPFKNVYLANIQQVYPWDRGTNYAVELGEKVTHLI